MEPAERKKERKYRKRNSYCDSGSTPLLNESLAFQIVETTLAEGTSCEGVSCDAFFLSLFENRLVLIPDGGYLKDAVCFLIDPGKP